VRAVDGLQLDDLDRKIISCLQKSGRQSNTQIAAQLRVSEGTIRKRIDWLTANDVIKITAVANPFKLNYPIVAIFGIRAVPSQISSLSERLKKLPEFRFIGMTVGSWDFVTEGWFESLAQMHDFLTKQVWPLKGIVRVETSHVIHMVRYAYDWGRNLNGHPAKNAPRNRASSKSGAISGWREKA